MHTPGNATIPPRNLSLTSITSHIEGFLVVATGVVEPRELIARNAFEVRSTSVPSWI